MTLLRKSACFASVVLAIQLLVIAGLLLVVTVSERKAEKLAYSRAAIYGSSRISSAFSEALYLMALVAAFSDRKATNQYDQLINEVATTLSDLQNDKCATPQDLKELATLSNEAGYLLRRMKQFEEDLQSCQSPESFILEGATFKATISPYLIRLGKSAKAFSQRHLAEERAIERKNGPIFFASIFGMMFLINVLTTVIYVIGFNKTVLRRLAMITENFVSFASNRQLHPIQKGNDEIANVDQEFHILSRSLSEVSAKDKAVFDNLPVGLLTCDQAGSVQNLNPRARLMLGEVAPGITLSELVEDAQPLAPLLKGQVTGAIRTRVKSAADLYVLTELSISRFLHEEKEHLLVALVDISEREEIENRRQEFVNIVSHDIRTPVTSVCMLLDLLKQEHSAQQGKAIDYCEKARAQLDTIMNLTSDLLDVARIEAGTIKLEREDTSVGVIMEQAIELVAMQAAHAGVRITEHPTDVFVNCDADRVQQILVNFLSNALKYTPAGKRIDVSARRDEDSVIISVKDQGTGIPAESLPLIFDRFVQGRSEDFKYGTGLGLAICKLLAESHGGKVGVKSSPGEGSEFWLQLPETAVTS